MDLRVGRGGVVTNFGDIHRIKDVMITAIVAVHIDFSFVGQDAIDLLIRQRFQRAGAALAGAGAFKLNALRLVYGNFFFVIQAAG